MPRFITPVRFYAQGEADGLLSILPILYGVGAGQLAVVVVAERQRRLAVGLLGADGDNGALVGAGRTDRAGRNVLVPLRAEIAERGRFLRLGGGEQGTAGDERQQKGHGVTCACGTGHASH